MTAFRIVGLVPMEALDGEFLRVTLPWTKHSVAEACDLARQILDVQKSARMAPVKMRVEVAR